MRYEIFYLIGASREAEVPKIKDQVKNVVVSAEGIFEEKETLEKRRLAYKIKKETHGVYIAQRFNLPDSEKIKDIISKLNLNSEILRFVLSRADTLPELKSKEERINEAIKRETVGKKIVKEKDTEKIKPKETGSKSSVQTEEDIDEKLKEILNI